MTNDKSAVLELCPWCQKTPKHGDSSYGYWTVFCGDENECPVSPHVEAPTEDEVIAAWNTRTLDPQVTALVEALVEASKGLKQDLLNRAEWDDDAKTVCAGAGAWFRFTTAPQHYRSKANDARSRSRCIIICRKCK
jgi:hypothetical protein